MYKRAGVPHSPPTHWSSTLCHPAISVAIGEQTVSEIIFQLDFWFNLVKVTVNRFMIFYSETINAMRS